MANTLIEWHIEVSDNIHSIIKDLGKIDRSIFQNRTFMNSVWDEVFKKISKFIEKRFDEGKSTWRPLKPKYQQWKQRAVAKGQAVNVGQFGRRVCKMNEIGRLTDTMFQSATSKSFANIFEVGNSPNVQGGSFRYAISGSKLPHAIFFDNKRPFFFLTEAEADLVFQVIEKRIKNKIDSIW